VGRPAGGGAGRMTAGNEGRQQQRTPRACAGRAPCPAARPGRPPTDRRGRGGRRAGWRPRAPKRGGGERQENETRRNERGGRQRNGMRTAGPRGRDVRRCPPRRRLHPRRGRGRWGGRGPAARGLRHRGSGCGPRAVGVAATARATPTRPDWRALGLLNEVGGRGPGTRTPRRPHHCRARASCACSRGWGGARRCLFFQDLSPVFWFLPASPLDAPPTPPRLSDARQRWVLWRRLWRRRRRTDPLLRQDRGSSRAIPPRIWSPPS